MGQYLPFPNLTSAFPPHNNTSKYELVAHSGTSGKYTEDHFSGGVATADTVLSGLYSLLGVSQHLSLDPKDGLWPLEEFSPGTPGLEAVRVRDEH